MAAELAIKITADGKAVVTAAKQAETALQGIDAQAGKTSQALTGTSHSSEGLESAMRALQAASQGYVAQLAASKSQIERQGAQLTALGAEVDRLKEKLARPVPVLPGAAPGLDKIGMSAKATAAAMRGVPAQFTDIVTSLQGGQAPLTVFLQQGGQLKDMFGGAGNAAKALGGYVMGLVSPFTVGAAVALGLAVAYEKGAGESRTFENAVTLSGNAVGLSSSQFSAMTQSIASVSGTRGAAAAALTEIASTGKLAGTQIEAIGTAAVLMEKATGQAVSDTVAQFVKLADEPVKASLELNKQYNYLTAAVYEQIKALEDQGNKLGAAELAEKSYADALRVRASSVIDNAGLMERAWRGITGAAKGAWDAMLGIGRPSTGADQIAILEKQLTERMDRNASIGIKDGRVTQELQAQIAALKGAQAGVDANTAAQEAYKATQKAGTAAIDAVGKANDHAASKQVKMNKALDDYRTNIKAIRASHPESELLDPKKIAAAEAGIRDQFKETAKTKKAALLTGESEVASIRAKVIETQRYIDTLKTQGLESAKQTEGEKLVVKIQQELEGSLKGVARANKEKALTAAQSLAGIQKESAALEALMKAQRDFEKDRDKEISGQEAVILKMEEKALAMEDQVRMYGMSAEAIEALSIARLQERADILAGFPGSEEQIGLIEKEIAARKRLALATDGKDALDAGVKAAKEADAEWKKTATSIENTLTDSLMRAFEGGKGFAQAMRDTIINMFKTMVLRPIIQAVMSPVSSAIGSVLGMPGAANAASGGMSTLSGLGSLVNIGSSIGSGITQTIANVLPGAVSSALGMSSSTLIASNAALAGGGASGAAAAAAAGAAGNATALGSIGSVLGTIPGWGWAAMAAIAVASIFGGRGEKEATGGGIEGKFSGTGFAGNSFSTWKQDGGWFHNDRSGKDTAALDAATAKQFSDAYGAVKTSATAAAVSLGLSADAIASYSQDISLQLGSDAAANEKAVAALFAGIGDNMALAAAPGIALLAKEGEAAGSTLMRLSTSLTAANAWLSMLRQRLFQVGLAGGDAASKLADAFGGLENLSAASKAFYETYFTEGERAARSQQDMTSALAKFNLALPASKDGLRELADSLDLNTESGRNAYAVLLAIAPEFAAVADLASKFAKETADKLLKTFSGNGQLLPALDVAALKTALLGDTLVSTYTVAGNISKLFLDVNSGLLTFGTRTSTLTDGLTGAQLAALSLSGQIDALHQGADRTRIDFVGLSAALEGVNIETFTNTIALVLDNLATRIGSVIDSIGSERIALREAALQIINPTVMSKDAITRAISAINVNSPSNTRLVAAQQALGRADANVGTQKSAVDYARSLAPSTAAVDAARATLGAATAATAHAQSEVDRYRGYGNSNFNYFMNQAYAGNDLRGTVPNPSGERNAQNVVFTLLARQAAQAQPQAAYDAQVAAYGKAVAVNAAQIAAAQAGLASATAAQAAAVTAARTAQTAYVASLQDFSIDASKAVGKLGKLREETVKYYDAQKQLADLMSNSADGLRTTVADYRYSQLSDAAQFDKLQADFAKNYAMALSTDGSMLAGYGDKLNAGLNPLLEKARDVLSGSAYDAFAATALARAEAIAGRLETLTPTNYAADSLAMLGQIDATLAALDASSKSAEKIISDAVAAGSDKTANGLRAVIAALTGKAIPAFAAGGAYQGGLALVGEKGPELINFNGGGQVYTAQQTRGMFAGGGNAEVVAELRALRQDNANMRAELRAIAGSSAKTARHLDRMDADGLLVRTDADTPLATVAA